MRAFRAVERGTVTTSFERWCKAVARNYANDTQRWDGLVELPDNFDRAAPAEDVERRVQYRLELEAVASVVRTLDDDQRMLLACATERTDEIAVRDRRYVAVHRLRKRIRVLAQSAMLGASGLICAARRRFANVTGAATIAAISITGSLVVLVPGNDAPTPKAAVPGSLSRDRYEPAASILETATAEGSASRPTTDARQYRLDAPLPGRRAVIYTRPPAKPDEPLFCQALPPVGDRACVAHPLRRGDDDALVTLR